MADALGLAVNIITVVDYGRQFAAAAWKIYQSGIEGAPGLASLKLATKNLRRIANELEEFPQSHGNEVDAGILPLVQRCDHVAQNILDTLASFEPPSDKASKKRRRAMYQAIVTTVRVKWKSDEIKGLEVELDGLRKGIMANLALFLTYVFTPSVRSLSHANATLGVG